MNAHPAQAVKDSQRLYSEVEAAVADFPKKYRYGLGADLRAWACNAHLAGLRASRLRKRPADQLAALRAMDDYNEHIKAGLEVARERQCFSSFGRFENLARLSAEIGRQIGGWVKEVQQQHLNGQSPAAFARPERPDTLSTPAASPEAQG